MIFTLEKLPENPNVSVLVEVQWGTTWSLFDMLREAFPNQDMYIGCWDGYENCIVLNQRYILQNG